MFSITQTLYVPLILSRRAVGKIQLAGIVIKVYVRVGDSWIREDAGVQAILSGLVLSLLLRHERWLPDSTMQTRTASCHLP